MTDIPPGAQTWIDKVAEIFAKVSDGQTGDLRSYKVAELNDLPQNITGAQAPCVVHYVRDCQPEYSTGGPTILMWEGRSDFHLTSDVKPANFGKIMLFYPRILEVAMANMQLGGLVDLFIIPSSPGAMRFVTYRNPDNTDSHQGIEVNWTVKQTVTGSYTVSA